MRITKLLLMVLNPNSFAFEGRIRKYEKIILEYHLEMGSFSSLSDTLVKLIAYLSIYGKLTQGQLKQLTQYSKSTISTGLSNLINIGHVRKEKIKSSREYYYFIAPSSQKSIDFALGTMENEIMFFKKKIEELENNFEENKKGYTILLNRLKDALDAYEYYQNILEILKNPNSSIELKFNREHQKSLTSTDFYNISLQFDPEIKRIEDEIRDFLMYESTYSILTEFTLMIYIIFITRGVLTQEKIRELTGLSLGKVSQVINALIKKGIILKVKKEKINDIIPEELKRQTIYSMKSIKDSFFMSGINGLKEMNKWEGKFKLIRVDLTENKEELESLRGYKQVLHSVNLYLNLLPLYKKATTMFSQLLA